MADKQIKKVVLAYSGGLDTSIIIPWLKENYGDPRDHRRVRRCGPGRPSWTVWRRRPSRPAPPSCIVADLTDEMVDDVIIPSMHGGRQV